ncbi:MAG: hypothetical protein F6K50_26250 [Moorea sp. SIO3I7]|nr:hypothetical protein [Moorena sp. SIO3I7]
MPIDYYDQVRLISYQSDAARSWGGSAVLGVPPMSDCRGFPHERLHQDIVLGFLVMGNR